MSSRLLVAEPVQFLAWASVFMMKGWRAAPDHEREASTRGFTYETMADLWNAWYGITFEEGLQDG